MNYSSYRKMIEEETKFLDTIPIEKYLEDGKDIYDIEDEIERDYGEYRPEKIVFNYMNTDEFLDYLVKRYHIKYTYTEEIHYYIFQE